MPCFLPVFNHFPPILPSLIRSKEENTYKSPIASNPLTSPFIQDVTVPGGQVVYIEPSGALGFAQVHSARIPDDSLLSNFTVITGYDLGLFKFNDAGWLACPTGRNGTVFPYKIFAYLTGVPDPDISGARQTNCTGLDILAANYTTSSSAAFEYI